MSGTLRATMPGANRPATPLHHYAPLLALLLFALVVQTHEVSSREVTLMTDVARTLLGPAILFIVFTRSAERTAMAVVLVLALAIGWAGYVLPGGLGHGPSVALHALMALYVWAAAVVIVRDLFRRPPTGAENVLGAICGYMLAADAWGSVNAFAYMLAPSSFSVNAEVAALLADWRGRLALFTYYAYAQMLTIGYADVTPIRTPATLLSLLAALFGIFYTAVVVSQLVVLAHLVRDEKT